MEDADLDISITEIDKTSTCETLSHNMESDSDSDVIYVERDEEIIELSDDEKNCSEILKNDNVSDQLIMDMRQASKTISKKIRRRLNNKSIFREVMRNSVWLLPWQVVSNIVNKPDNVLKKSSEVNTNFKKRASPGKADDSKKKRAKVDKTVNNNLIESVKVREEKVDDATDDDEVLSFVHFDPIKPPGFCEVSRSGRLIKKPCRLQDEISIYKRRKNKHQKKSNDSVLDGIDDVNRLSVKIVYESLVTSEESMDSCNDDAVSLDKKEVSNGASSQLVASELNLTDSPDNSRNHHSPGTSFKSDRVKNESNTENSFTDFKTIVLDDFDESNSTFISYNSSGSNLNLDNVDFVKNSTLIPHSNDSRITRISTLNKSYDLEEKVISHKNLERIRRKDMQLHFHNLMCAIGEVQDGFNDSKIPKVQILNEAINTIKRLDSKLKDQMNLKKEYEKDRERLIKNVDSLYEMK